MELRWALIAAVGLTQPVSGREGRVPGAFIGAWASSLEQCRDIDGVSKIWIDAHRITYYESWDQVLSTRVPRAHQVALQVRWHDETYEHPAITSVDLRLRAGRLRFRRDRDKSLILQKCSR